MINVLLIGCGNIGAIKQNDIGNNYLTHAHCLNYLKNKKLIDNIYFCDSNRNTLINAKNLWGIDQGEENLSLFSNEILNSINIIIIAVNTKYHYDIFKQIFYLKNKFINLKTIICEKPCCENYQQIKEISELFKDINIIVNYSRDFNFSLNLFCDRIKNNQFGKIQTIIGKYCRGLKNDGSHMINFLLNIINIKSIDQINKIEIFDFISEDPTINIKFNSPNCENVYMFGYNGNDYKIFDLEVITDQSKIWFSDFFRKVYIFTKKQEKVYGNFSIIDNEHSNKCDINLSMLDLYKNLFESDFKIKNFDNAIKIHELINTLHE